MLLTMQLVCSLVVHVGSSTLVLCTFDVILQLHPLTLNCVKGYVLILRAP